MFLFCSEINFVMPFVDGELPVFWWDTEADRCMIIGVFKHGKWDDLGTSSCGALAFELLSHVFMIHMFVFS
jgi:hypothetical protein